MNERIKALMGKTLDSEFSHTWDTMTYEGLLQFSEKFAELIVRECAQSFEAEVDTWKEMVPYQGSMKRKGTQAIKQHFGVE